jgi:hypothetical protein
LQQPPDHRFGRPAVGFDTQGDHGRGRDVIDPLGNRRVGAVTGHNGADSRADHGRQPVPHTTTGAGSGKCASAAGSPAVSGTVAPAGEHDKAEISDDGDAGMAHFGQINKA